MGSNTLIPVRSIRDNPFAWASKAALRRIQDRFEESDKVPVAISVYMALCVSASDVQREEFTVKIAQIASRAGVSYKTAHIYLCDLETAGLVNIKRSTVPGTKLDAPSTYTLLSVCSSDTARCSSDIPLCSRGVEPSFTERIEESEKNTEKKTRTRTSASARKERFSAEVVQGIYDAYPKKSARGPTLSETKGIRKALDRVAKFEPDPAAWMLNRVEQYAIYARTQLPRFVKTLLNYFRDESYNDVYRS